MDGYARQLRSCAAFLLLCMNASILPFQLGIENLSAPARRALVADGALAPRVGLISNQTALDQSGRRTVDVLKQEGMRIAYILAPEHGFDGKALAGKPIRNGVDEKTGIPIVTVYGRGGDYTIAGKRIDPAIMKQLDAVLYDIQDSGMRHYTYISTLLCALEAAAEHGKPLYVFDRPNLLGGNIEGPLVDPELKSFISIAPIALRHGMTVGELARYFNAHVLQKPAALHVIPLTHFNRIMRVPFLNALSPNLPTRQSVYGYSFLGIVGEVKPFHVGVGSERAFQVIMLPDALSFPSLEWRKLSALLKEYGIHSCHETMLKRDEPHTGLRLSFPDNAQFSSFALLIKLLSFFKKRGITFSFSPTFDKAVGTPLLRKWCQGESLIDPLINQVKADLQGFYKKAQECFLYHPHPTIKT